MAFTVRITTRAFNDIRRNIDWWSEHRLAVQAGEWCDLVLRKIDGLSVMPESYPLGSENQKTPYELREMHVGCLEKQRIVSCSGFSRKRLRFLQFAMCQPIRSSRET